MKTFYIMLTTKNKGITSKVPKPKDNQSGLCKLSVSIETLWRHFHCYYYFYYYKNFLLLCFFFLLPFNNSSFCSQISHETNKTLKKKLCFYFQFHVFYLLCFTFITSRTYFPMLCKSLFLTMLYCWQTKKCYVFCLLCL